MKLEGLLIGFAFTTFVLGNFPLRGKVALILVSLCSGGDGFVCARAAVRC
jgi:hypothetical protein